jgi:two-component system cell cycle response regulator DivK
MADSPLILVVDDSPIQRKLYSAALRTAGYDVIVAANGLEGVEMALQHVPDLIVMDVSMPEMDGPTAVQELRRYPALDRVPVLALTAVTEPDDVENLYQAGFDDVVDKNSDRAVMLACVHRWLAG